MKTFNHKQIIGLFYSCQQLSQDPQDRGIEAKHIHQIIEILRDCNCQDACRQLIPGFVTAERFIEMGDYNAAGVSLSVTSEKMGLLTIPDKIIVDN